MLYDDYAWVVRGKQRRAVMKALIREKIPTQVKEATNLALNNVSDVLRAFEKRKLVECLNPEAKTGRIYKLTSKGLRVRERIEQNSE